MPNIKQYVAGGQAAQLNTTNRQFPVQSFEGLGSIGRALEKLGSNLGDLYAIDRRRMLDAEKKAAAIEEKLQKQQNEHDFLNISNQYDAERTALIADLPALEENPLKWTDTFLEREAELRKKFRAMAPNIEVGNMFETHIVKTFPEQAVKVRNAGLKQSGQNIVSEFDTFGEQLSNEAATSLEPDEYVKAYSSRVATLRARGFIDGAEAEKRVRKFALDVQQKTMNTLLNNDQFDELRVREARGDFKGIAPDARAKILHESINRENQIQTRQRQIADEGRKLLENKYWEAANTGNLDILALQNDPMIPEQTKNAIVQRNDDPPFGQGAPQQAAIKSIWSEYTTALPTQQRIDHFLKRFNDFERANGPTLSVKDRELIAKYRYQLTVNDRAVLGLAAAQQAAGRATTNFEASQLSRAVDKALAEYDSIVPPDPKSKLSEQLSNKYKNQRATERASIERRIKAGEDPDLVIKDIIAKRQAKDKPGQQAPKNPAADFFMRNR